MISEGLIKLDFIAQIGKEQFERLAKRQIQILEARRGTLTDKRFDVDKLISDVRGRQMSITATGEGLMFEFQVLKKLRFADMKKHGNAKVYNRPLWGIVFGKRYSLMTRLQTEFTENTRDMIYNQLHDAVTSDTTKIVL